MPLFELVCGAAQKQMNAVWLAQAGRLILQMNPPSFSSLKSVPSDDVMKRLANTLPVLIQSTLNFLSVPGGMNDVR